MTIFMTYHTLVERDSRFVSRKWQTIIILLLTAIFMCNLIAGFKIHFLDTNFKEYCFINSKIYFKPKTLNLQEPPDNPNFRMRTIGVDEFNDKDKYFFEHAEIDERATMWGNQRNCIFVSLTPLFFCFWAIVWIVMFFTFGHGGTTKSFIIGKPWIIVIPSLVFFISAAIATFILLVVLKSAIDAFCVELNQHLNSDYYCGFLLEQFSLVDMDDQNFSRDCYSIILKSLMIANVIWVIAAIIMVLRIIFVIDFQLVRVTISIFQPPIIDENHFIDPYNNDDNDSDDDAIDDDDPNDIYGIHRIRVSFDPNVSVSK